MNLKKEQDESQDIKAMQIKDINTSIRKANLKGVINKIVQTGGPTIFSISDGTGNITIKDFVKPGQRAYPEIDEGSFVTALIKVGSYKGVLEGEIRSIEILNEQEKDLLKQEIKRLEIDGIKVKDIGFLVDNRILDKLKNRFILAAQQIKLAIVQERPIIVRHHNDCDGYSAGFALEQSIVPLIVKQHHTPKAQWEFFLRAPCQAPYYEIDDSIRDTSNSLRNAAKFSNRMPLIIIADNGSCEADLMAIKQARIHNIEFIVVDHHGFDKDVISQEVLTHINPFLVGENGSAMSAGMLCVELARYINNDVKNMSHIAAMSGYADRIDLTDERVVLNYLSMAEKEGYNRELLSDIGLVIEYVSSKVRFMEVREYIEVLFGEPRDKQTKLVSLMAPYIRDLDRKGLAIGKAGAIQEKFGNLVLQTIEIDKFFPGFGFFPKPGRAVGLIHDNYVLETSETALITVGIMNTAVTIRATTAANFSIHSLKVFLMEQLPDSFVEGGGHKNAGALNFIPCMKNDVVRLLKEFITQKNKR